MNREQKLIAESILQYYGFSNQKQKTIEELGELIVALSRNLQRFWDAKTQDEVMSEIADVKIMIEQMELVFDRHKIDKLIDEKLLRQRHRISTGEDR